MGDVCGCVVLIRAGIDILFWAVSLFVVGFPAFSQSFLNI